MEFNLTKPQSEFNLVDKEHIAAVAGYGSGKTEGVIARIVTNLIEQKGVPQGYFAPTYGLIRDIFYPRIGDVLSDMGIKFDINKSEHHVKTYGYGDIYCRSMERPDKIVGFEVGTSFMDEIDLLPIDKAMEVYRKVSARTRYKIPGEKFNKKYVATTPEGFKATYKLFKKEPLVNSALIQMTTYSNQHNLPPGYIDGLKAQYPEELIKAYLLGEFVNLVSGAVYPYFDRETHHTDSIIKLGEPLHIGMDFNVLKMCAAVFNDRCEAIDEFANYADTPTLINAMRERYAPGKHFIYVYPDASGKSVSSKGFSLSDHNLLRKAGLRVMAPKANPLIKERVMSVNAKLIDQTLRINTKTCPFLTECLEQQVYDKNGMPDKSSGIDNMIDALGYRIAFNWLISKKQFYYGRQAA